MRACRFTIAAAPIALSLLAASSVQAQDTERCRSPESFIDRAACDKARQGPEALRRFVQRTQPTMQLYFWDYMSREQLEKHHAQQPQKEKVAETPEPKAG